MAQLEGMGFPTIRCQKALLATGNSDAEAAMEWLFGHMEDPDIDDPIQIIAAGAAGSSPEPSQEQISMLTDMGFTSLQAKKALRETVSQSLDYMFTILISGHRMATLNVPLSGFLVTLMTQARRPRFPRPRHQLHPRSPEARHHSQRLTS